MMKKLNQDFNQNQMKNTPTKLMKYLKTNGISLISIFRATITAEGETVSYKSIWNAAHGYTVPKMTTMKAIAKALKVPMDSIF